MEIVVLLIFLPLTTPFFNKLPFVFLILQPDQPASYPSEDLPHGAVYSLDSNHSHFILVEEDPKKPGATSDMRVKLLKHISEQRTGHGGAYILSLVP